MRWLNRRSRTGGVPSFSRQPPRAGDIFEALLLDNFIPTSTAILPKTIFDGGLRFRGEYSPAEDYDFWLRAARRGTARFCPEPLAVYHRHPGQWGADLGVMFPSCARVVEDALRDAHRTVAAVPGARRRLWQLHFVAARAMAAAGRWQDAADALVRAAALRPFDWRSVVFLLRARACAGRLSARL
ncbi:MAG: hypothetical protein M5R36_13540 [Deltaproteobacteria bacterium]|nr:hypothetical protein [Deltaproteobacteria bacterium]